MPYRPHYLINAIEVRDRPGLRTRFAGQAGVASVLFQPNVRPYPRTFQLPAMDPTGAQGVEWNVREIGADRVWEQGFSGEGVIVGGADSGVAWDHPALKRSYLGWNGQRAVHDYQVHHQVSHPEPLHTGRPNRAIGHGAACRPKTVAAPKGPTIPLFPM